MAGIQRSSYYDRSHRQSPALIRARRPYLVKNAILGASISAFAIGVYIYTLNVVGQDEFEDVKVPDAPMTNTPSAITQAAKK
ncbi:cytochrome c oxidase assembly factor 3, mitochondrial [Diplogelasinospora grovesii]|uniref:Cytochrome c oxidase assembly factor 3 n=1 Tax=Diplogelasinospora grovesii TaxID=303347 RepID=A0AAN6S0J9_9PEZI|nr:cytochrome c oxidase assembly factor 3, mitochondrial [Diplogelasinospora grovesii]